MSFEKRWLLKDRVCYIQFTGTITFENINELSSDHEALMSRNEQANRIHYIVNTEKVSEYPRDVRSITRQLVSRINGVGWLLMINNDFFIEHLGSLLGQLFHFNVKSVVSLKHAYRFLQSIDEVSLPQNWPENVQDTMPQR